VLRPLYHTSNLDIWSFYRTESLAHDPSYDIELTESELRDEEDESEVTMDGLMASADNSQRRRVLNGCYDNIELMQPAGSSFMLSVSCFFPYTCSYITNVAHTRTHTHTHTLGMGGTQNFVHGIYHTAVPGIPRYLCCDSSNYK